MDVKRAQEIIGSEQTFRVQLNGEPVWIDSVDPVRDTALVHLENNRAESRTVPVEELAEVQ